MKDYDFELAYHLGKANVVADALSRKSYMTSLIHLVAAGVNTELGPVCLITKLLPGCWWYI